MRIFLTKSAGKKLSHTAHLCFSKCLPNVVAIDFNFLFDSFFKPFVFLFLFLFASLIENCDKPSASINFIGAITFNISVNLSTSSTNFGAWCVVNSSDSANSFD